MEDILKGAERTINNGATRLVSGVEKARSKGIDTLDAVRAGAEEAADQIEGKGKAFLSRIQDTGLDLLEDVQSDGEEAWSQVQKYIKKNPAQTIGYSLLAGLAVGFFITRKLNR